jgi:hypothetical protein
MAFDEFLDPPGENFDVEEPDLSDIIVHFSENTGGDTGGQDTEDDQDEYIFGPPLDILSRVEAIEYTVNSRFRHSQVRHTFSFGTKICWMDPLFWVFSYIRAPSGTLLSGTQNFPPHLA